LPVPIPEQSPQPEYPASALRSGQTGTVRVRVEVDAQGVPGAVVVVDRSGSRDLDRAAVDAVKNWRFQPALRNGQAVPGVIEIPFDFRTSP
jgi:protein TonB